MILPNLQAEATTTQHLLLPNANSNSAVQDLQGYKGAVSFLLSVGQSAVTAGNVPNCYILDSADNSSFAAVSGGAFTAAGNTMNANNCSVQVLSFATRTLRRYVYIAATILGTNPNVPIGAAVIGQKERV
jgi:hypothetical protein